MDAPIINMKNNPYTKPTNYSSFPKDAKGRLIFNSRYSTSKWLWFEVSGELWHSKERYKYQMEFARDYTYRIFERYQRRFGYLSKLKALIFLGKVKLRWNWESKAAIHIPEYGDFDRGDIDHEFCPIGHVGYLYHDAGTGPYYEYETCIFCGANLQIKKGATLKEFHWEPGERYSGGDMWLPATLENKTECSNSMCRESRLFMEEPHSLTDAAKQIKVYRKRPLKKYQHASLEEKAVIAAYALLDFEARYKEKIDKIGDSK